MPALGRVLMRGMHQQIQEICPLPTSTMKKGHAVAAYKIRGDKY
jgi:hypothetical protein